jgi:hypothetical protein
VRTFDLFQQFGPKKALWIQDFAELEDAVSEMKKLASRKPGTYFVYDEDSAATVSRMCSESLPNPPCAGSSLLRND